MTLKDIARHINKVAKYIIRESRGCKQSDKETLNNN